MRLSPVKFIMGESAIVSLLLVFNYLLLAEAQAANEDLTALQTFQKLWLNTPPIWVGSDPCDGWDGIKCTSSRVTSITLSNTGLTGQLSGDIGLLSELEILDLSNNKGLTGSLPKEIGSLKKLTNLFLVGCGFTGSIPDEIGNLQQLVILSLNSNNFSGQIPPSIGNLSNLNWLDVTENDLDGPIPVSSGSNPGLDMLLNAKHFHLGNNRLSGGIPPQLFSSEMTLIHLLFDRNQLTGSIPPTLGLVRTLELVRFDHNLLNGSVPQILSNLSNVAELYLSNNKLSGPPPNLSGMNKLQLLDMSNNSFEQSDFPSWFSTLKLLVTLKMENTQLHGQIDVSFFTQLPHLQIVILKHNELNGSLNISITYSQLQLIDLQNNQIENFEQGEVAFNVKIILKDNPICYETGVTKNYCSISQPNNSFTTPSNHCFHTSCSTSDQIPSPNCKCAYPFTGTLTFRTPSYLYLGSRTDLENNLLKSFQSNNLPVDSVSLSAVTKNPFQDHDFSLQLQIFPSGQDRFNHTGISSISLLLSNRTLDAYSFVADNYVHYEELGGSSKSSNTSIVIGAAVGGSVLLVLLLLAGAYAFWQKKRADDAIEKSNPFGSWDPSVHHSSVPQVQGARCFSFEELQKYTNNFSQANDIGRGGYGKVCRGTLPNGQLVAIKRSQKESMQGGIQFKAEIELLSRVHHKNLVSLVGFCFDRGEEILVYEYVQNGNLKDALSGKSGIRLDWNRRLKVALGVARGLAYLHEHANPPIIHRDIKSNNILLDRRLNAKVADFGLSKSMLDHDEDHITTQVRGTLGYLDPEYYTSQRLTEKSDVYSFGVLMLELITARKPIDRGNYIVKVIRNAIDKTKDLYGLHEILDPTIGLGSTLSGFDKFVDVAMSCVQESGTDRPAMGEVVKEIEIMLQSTGINPNTESGPSTSASFEKAAQGSSGHPYSNESVDSSGPLPVLNVEPK